MKRLTAVLAAAALPLAAAAAPESFTIDPYHSFPYFDVLHLGTSLIRGRFDKTSGKITLDAAAKTGSVDLVIEAGLKQHDIVALIPIIEGAGGVITSWEGGSAAKGGRVVAAGDKRVHEAAMKVLAS